MPSNFRKFVAMRDARDLPLFRYAERGACEIMDKIDQRYFTATLLAALALHAAALIVWHFVPKTPVIDVPVRALNIKLGDGEIMVSRDVAVAQPGAANKANVETAISRLVRNMNAESQARAQAAAKPAEKAPPPAKTPAKSTRKFDFRQEKPSIAAPVVPVVARHFVRDLPVPAKSAERVASVGTPVGNSKTAAAEMVARYEQLISLWIQKFKLYPDEARTQNMRGETAVRIRIDRRGNIHYYILEGSTGHPILDRAAIDMVRRANPVPAVPADYPAGDSFEFKVPVRFRLHE